LISLKMCYTQFWNAYEVRYSVVFVRLYTVDQDTLTQQERSDYGKGHFCASTWHHPSSQA
jgi:hypothetical protein